MLKNIYFIILLLIIPITPIFAESPPFVIENIKNKVIHSVGAVNGYNATLLKLALSYSKKNYNVSAFTKEIPKGRRFILLNNSNDLQVAVGSATRTRERELLAIPFPIMKGLFGWRVPLINKDTPDLFKNIYSIKEFKALTPIQFHSWSDTKILGSNGINVIKGGSVEGLYSMLDKKRADYFPRSITEIDINIKEHEQLNIGKDTYALLYYPTAFYFYVGKSNTELATDIKQGLEHALKDGEFDKVFLKFYGKYAKQIEYTKRKIFKLSNPFLPEVIPLERKELWVIPKS